MTGGLVATKAFGALAGLAFLVFDFVVVASPIVWLAGASLVTWLRRDLDDAFAPVGARRPGAERAPVPPLVKGLARATLAVLAAGTLAAVAVVVIEARPGLGSSLFAENTLLVACMALFIALFVLYAATVGSYLAALVKAGAERPRWLIAWVWLVPPAALLVAAGTFVAAVGFALGGVAGD